MELFDQRYELLEKLGEGGLASVHLAQDMTSGRCVALKMLHPEASADSLELKFFEHEFRALSQLDLPGVPRAYDFGRMGSLPYFTMQFVQGESMCERLGSEPEWTAAASLLGRAALRLDGIHRAGFVHRDVKAANVLIDKAGRPWWIDFGIACPIHSAPFREEDELVVGTLPYLSPERVRLEMRVAHPTADVYSLGVVLYRLLTGVLPFDGGHDAEIMLRIQYEEPRPPCEFPGRDVPRSISDVALQAMAKRPEERYQTAWDFAAAVGDVLMPIAAERISGQPQILAA